MIYGFQSDLLIPSLTHFHPSSAKISSKPALKLQSWRGGRGGEQFRHPFNFKSTTFYYASKKWPSGSKLIVEHKLVLVCLSMHELHEDWGPDKDSRRGQYQGHPASISWMLKKNRSIKNSKVSKYQGLKLNWYWFYQAGRQRADGKGINYQVKNRLESIIEN